MKLVSKLLGMVTDKFLPAQREDVDAHFAPDPDPFTPQRDTHLDQLMQRLQDQKSGGTATP